MKLIAVSPIGKNGQTVVPARIRRMFKVAEGHNLVGFYEAHGHVEIAPVRVQKAEVDYTEAELTKMERLAKQKGGRRFGSASTAKELGNFYCFFLPVLICFFINEHTTLTHRPWPGTYGGGQSGGFFSSPDGCPSRRSRRGESGGGKGGPVSENPIETHPSPAGPKKTKEIREMPFVAHVAYGGRRGRVVA